MVCEGLLMVCEGLRNFGFQVSFGNYTSPQLSTSCSIKFCVEYVLLYSTGNGALTCHGAEQFLGQQVHMGYAGLT